MDDDDVDSVEDLEVGLGECEHGATAPWKALFHFTCTSHFVVLTLALIFSIASGIVVPALAIFLGKIFDQFSFYGAGSLAGSGFAERVAKHSTELCVLGGVSGILNGAFYGFWLAFGEAQARSAREQLFNDIQDKEMVWFDMRRSGIETLVSRLQSQVRDLQQATSQSLGFAVQCFVTAVAALILSLYYAWSLTLVTLALIPLSTLLLACISARMQPAVDGHTHTLTQASKLVAYGTTAIDAVKSLNAQNHEVWYYSRAVQKAAKYFVIQAQGNAVQIGFVRLITLGMFVQGFWYGSHLVNSGKKTTGDIITAFMSALIAAQSVEQVLPQLIVLQKGRAAGAILRAIQLQVERGRRIGTMVGNQRPAQFQGSLELKGVCFSYPTQPDRLVLDNVNISFPAGKTTFVVGNSGSGKSTVGNLLLGMYRPASGTVLMDGYPIQVLDTTWLRNKISLCQQQSVLFNESVFKNIAYGRQDHDSVKKKDLKSAVEMALLSSVIKALPHGLDTVVGAGGTSLSGGQKQRVAIARTRLRDASVLILDEATSALDYMTKVLVFEAIRKWRHGKTTIIITHDMQQIQEDDFVYVLEQGRLVHQGLRHELRRTPNCLMAMKPPPTPRFPVSPRRNSIDGGDSVKLIDVDTARRKDGLGDSILSRTQPKRGGQFLPSTYIAPRETTVPRPSLSGLLSPISPTASSITLQPGASVTTQSPRFKRPQDLNIADIIELSCIKEQYGSSSAGWVRPISARRHSGADDLLSPPRSPWERRLSTASIILGHVTQEAKTLGKETIRQVISIRKILSSVWPSLSPAGRWTLLLGFLCASIHASATPVFSWAFAKLLGSIVIAHGPSGSSEARKWSLVVLAIATTDAIASYFMHYLLERCGQAWVDHTRVEAFKRILDQPRAWFDSEPNSVARLAETLDSNAEEMRNLLGRFAGHLSVAACIMVVSLVWSLVLNSTFTLVGLASTPAIYAVTRAFELVTRLWERNSNEAGVKVGDVFHETFNNVRTVLVLTLERYFHDKCMKATKHAFRVGLRRSLWVGCFFGLSDCAFLFVIALILWYGAHLTSTDPLILQNILSALTILLFGISNVNAAVAFIPQISSARTTADQLLRLSTLPYQKSHEHTGHARLNQLGLISFNDASLTYPSRPTYPALSSLDLELPCDRTTALVGPSGCGKSSIASLLQGLYPPSSGSISVNQVPLRNVHLPTLRSLIAVVPQQPTLFPATVAENIAYALPERSPLSALANVRSAAKTAGIDEFIMTLPDGYRTLIGPGGTGLSGGQQQRIAVARAIARRPQYLILDEATSGLDSQTAEYVGRLIRGMQKEGTGVLVITHDKRMMEVCQDVVVMKDGRVVENGSYEDLRRRKGGELRKLFGG